MRFSACSFFMFFIRSISSRAAAHTRGSQDTTRADTDRRIDRSHRREDNTVRTAVSAQYRAE